MKTKLLVTGASSQLMQELIPLLKEEYEITGFSRKLQKNNNDIRWIKGDLIDKERLNKAIENQEIIIHAGAITHSFKEKPYFDINFEGTKNLVEIANRKRIKKIIFISTRTAEANSGTYGESKLKAENYIKNNFSNWLIFRISEVFGGSKNEGIEKLIRDVSIKKVVFYPTGLKSKLFPIHSKDCINIIRQNLNEESKTIYINGNKGFTYLELINKVKVLTNKNPITIPIPKFLVFTLGWFLKTMNINVGINPDQIKRLYCEKGDSVEICNIQFSLEEYIVKNLK